jgi:3-oxoacyl-[acyl-carrier-protein] synthase-3
VSRTLATPVGITAMGQYYPDRIVTNDDLSTFMDTNDEWIRTRTGISQRRWVEKGTGASDLAAPALQMALKHRGITPDDLDAIIVATVTPDMLFPATACLVQNKIGATNAYGFDLSAACSGFLFALTTGANLIASGTHKRVAVIGVDVMSSILNMEDRTTTVLFGDGAGAVILEAVEGATASSTSSTGWMVAVAVTSSCPQAAASSPPRRRRWRTRSTTSCSTARTCSSAPCR